MAEKEKPHAQSASIVNGQEKFYALRFITKTAPRWDGRKNLIANILLYDGYERLSQTVMPAYL